MDLYILAKKFILDADLFFFFFQKKGYMRSLLGRHGGA